MRKAILAVILGTVLFATGCDDADVEVTPILGTEHQYIVNSEGGAKLPESTIRKACPGSALPVEIERTSEGEAALVTCPGGHD